MSDTSPDAPIDARVPLRNLPARPRLDYERKQAKALLRALRDGEAEAAARAQAVGERASNATSWQLADAQRIVAREYGFASWPKLVRWFEALKRQGGLGWRHDLRTKAYYKQRVDGLLNRFSQRDEWAARVLTAYSPRWFGAPIDQVWTVTPTREEAEHVIARANGFESWAMLMEVAPETTRVDDHWTQTPEQRAWDALDARDLSALEGLMAAYPALLRNDPGNERRGLHLMRSALSAERKHGREALRPIMMWLEARGFDRQRTLDAQLGTMWGQFELDAYLEQGANPNAVLPNGIPVIEHVLVAMWKREKVDQLAARVTPRAALWIAAGLGDIPGMARMLDAAGRPLPAARAIRPHFDAVFTSGGAAVHPNPPDEELLREAMIIAALNDRAESMAYLVSRGVSINCTYWGMTPLGIVVGRGPASTVARVLELGADPDAIVPQQSQSSRDIARWLWLDTSPRSDTQRDSAVLMGWDPDALLAERIAANPAPPLDERSMEAIARARHDAATQRARSVQPLHLLFALMSTYVASSVLHHGLDRDRFLALFGPRIARVTDLEGGDLPLHARTERVVRDAQQMVSADGREHVHQHQLLWALLKVREVSALLTEYGVDLKALEASTARA